mmetsp:Transcript_19837/g.38537  ORF Transcript_19837/g.38537 Transcript_19837/m.38537 type:complete len:174 (+) Transcript_19837:270-791(+)
MGGIEAGKTEWKPTKHRGFFLGPEANSPTCNDLLWTSCIKAEQRVQNSILERKLHGTGGAAPQTDQPPWMKGDQGLNVSPKSRVPLAAGGVARNPGAATKHTGKKLDDVGVMMETVQILRKAKQFRTQRQKTLLDSLHTLQMVRSRSVESHKASSAALRLPAISPSRSASNAA